MSEHPQSECSTPTQQQIERFRNAAMGLCQLSMQPGGGIAPSRLAYFPYLTSQKFYDLTVEVSLVWQKLCGLASMDSALIRKTFELAGKSDPFIGRLLELYNLREDNKKDNEFILLRSDYIKDREGLPKLVEVNTNPGGNMDCELIHEAKRLTDWDNHEAYSEYKSPNPHMLDLMQSVFQKRQQQGVALLVIDPNELNKVEISLYQVSIMRRGIRVIRTTLLQAADKMTIQESQLFYAGCLVHLVNLRTDGRQNEDSPDREKSWKARRMIEEANVVVYPSISMEMVRQKRMQAELSKRKIYQKYLTPAEIELLEKSLVECFDLDGITEERLKQLIEEAEKDDKRYVMKPNAEGGGNNLYGQEIVDKLRHLSRLELSSYILMERIQTNSFRNILIDEQSSRDCQCEAEVSHFGLFKIEKGILVKNQVIGHFVRVKPRQALEVGMLKSGGAIGTWLTTSTQ